MKLSSETWRWAGILAVIICILLTTGLMSKNYRTISGLKEERLELQDSLLSLKKDLLERDEAAILAEQVWQETQKNYVTETRRLQAELNRVRKNYKETLAEIDNLDTCELKTYFAERYGVCADTAADSVRFLLTVDVGNHIRYDLTDLDFCNEESRWQDSIIFEQARYIENLDTTATGLLLEKSYYKDRAASFEQQWNASEQTRLILEKNLSRQQNLSCILGGTAAVLVMSLIVSIVCQ